MHWIPVIVWLGAFFFPASFPMDENVVHLFQHGTDDEQFPGEVWRLEPGELHHEDHFHENEVSAVLIPQGLRVALYEEGQYHGRRLLLGPGMHNLATHGWNDRVSSARVEGPASLELFEHSVNFDEREGAVWTLALDQDAHDQFFEAPGDFDDGTLSTVRVPEGYEVILFDDAAGEGLALVLKAGQHELDPRGFNDRVSAIRVLRSR